MSRERICSKAVVTISPDATVLEAAKLMHSKHIGSLIVVEDSHPIGIVTDRDIALKVVASEKKPAETAVKKIMTTNPMMVNSNYDVLDAVRLMHEMMKDRAEDVRHWLIECPFTGTLADAYIGPREVSFERLIEIKSCSLWAEKAYCGQECIGNT
ncbi:MAG TPA: CBS domain-containing protein [Candidatus Binatia bacterium]|nr:CBS domain-containing protein [Candidatus Binatia bacterium]